MRIWRLQNLVIAFAVMILLVATYYIVKYPVESMFGERYVREQIPLLFPFFVIQSFKPITIMVILGFTLWATALEIPSVQIRLSKVFPRIMMSVSAFVSCYELIWNYVAWFTLWSMQGGSLDALSNTTHEHAGIPVSFNFATKIYFLATAICLYGVWRTSRKP